jgi:hypothetical protein
MKNTSLTSLVLLVFFKQFQYMIGTVALVYFMVNIYKRFFSERNINQVTERISEVSLLCHLIKCNQMLFW